jgi:urea carboxylase-associated protein 2
MGRIFCSIVTDTAGWHDTVCGNSTRSIVAKKWGEASYQTHRNDRHQSGLDSFLVEAAKYGMKRRDLAANVNWFSKVAVDDTGMISFDASAARAGSSIELRFEMDTLVLFHTCPHPLDPSATYPHKSIRFELFEGPAAETSDACRLSAPENGRGFENNRLFHSCGCH